MESAGPVATLAEIEVELRAHRDAETAWVEQLLREPLGIVAARRNHATMAAPPPENPADLVGEPLERATLGKLPFFAGRLASEALARDLANAEGELAGFLCGGALPNEYDSEPFSDALLVAAGFRGLGGASNSEQGYLWLLLGTPFAFTFYVLSDEPRDPARSGVQPQYAGYTIVTRIGGTGTGVFQVGEKNGITWKWRLEFRRAVAIGGFKGGAWVSSTSLIGAGAADAGSYSSLLDEPDGVSIYFLLQPLTYSVYDKVGLQIDHRAIPDCYSTLTCPEVAVWATCEGRAGAVKIGAYWALQLLATTDGIGQLEAEGGTRGAYLGPECAHLRHAVYLLSNCTPLTTGVSEWYFDLCAGHDWGLEPEDPEDPEAGEDE